MSRIGINLLWLRPGIVGGTEEYATRLLDALADRDDEIRLHLFVNDATARVHEALVGRFSRDTCRLGAGRPGTRMAAEATWLRRAGTRCDAMHHLGGTVPLGATEPQAVTIYDLQPLLVPERFTRLKRRYLSVQLPRAVRRATVVVTISDWVAETLADRLDVDRDRIAVVAPSAPTMTQPTPDEVAAAQAAFRLERPYVVYPAITYEHKNHAVLLAAMAMTERNVSVDLVLTGASGPHEQAVQRQILALGLTERVHRLGRIDRQRLDALVAGAIAMVFPSRFEGFGQPVVEAMALGCPVIASSSTALPETVGRAGCLLDPDDVPAWSAAIEAHLGLDQAERTRRIEAGRAQVGRFAPDRSAAAQLGVYRRLLEHPG